MTERWRDELTKLHRAELPDGLWDRARTGPRMAPLPERDPSRATTVGVAVLVVALMAGLAWIAIRRADAPVPLGDPDSVTVPPRGEVAPVFAPDGRPVFVVHHEDGTVGVVDGFSGHHPYSFDDILGWCPSTREFVELAHQAHYDERGIWIDRSGPTGTGLTTYDVGILTRDAVGDPATIRIGRARAPDPGRSAPTTDPDTYPPRCPDTANAPTDLVLHTVPADAVLTPRDAVAITPDGYVAVRGTLQVRTPLLGAEDGDPWAQMCSAVVDGTCVDGVPVVNIDALGLLTGVLMPSPGSYYEEEQVWLTRVRDGVLVGLGGVPPDRVS